MLHVAAICHHKSIARGHSNLLSRPNLFACHLQQQMQKMMRQMEAMQRSGKGGFPGM
jgi:hypothetical protein